MRILIHGINFWPELTGVGKYTGEMAAGLAARGHQVKAVVAPPYYPMWRVGPGYSPWRYQRERYGQVEVFRCPLWIPRRQGGLRRLLHLVSFTATSLPVMLAHVRWRPDVVIVVEPTLFCAPQAWLAARLSRGLSFLHVQDFEVDAAFGLGLLKSAVLSKLARGLESLCMRRFDVVSTISQRMLAGLINKGVDEHRTYFLPNWVDTEAILPLPAPSPMRESLGIPTTAVVVLYAGNLGEKQGLELLIEAAHGTVDATQLVWVISGDGAARDRLREMARGLPNVRWLPLQPMERLNDLLNLADIHVLPQRAEAAELVMPSKLTGMLASGRPVVTTARRGTELASVVEQCGIVTRPGDTQALVTAIVQLAVNVEERARLGSAARRYAVRHMSRDEVLLGLERHLLGLTTPSYNGCATASAVGHSLVEGQHEAVRSARAEFREEVTGSTTSELR